MRAGAAGDCRVGTSRQPIEVPAGTRLSAYAALGRRYSSEVLDELFVRAIVLDCQGSPAVVVSCDLTHLGISLVHSIRRQLQQEQGIPGESVLVCCTHSHSSPSARYVRQGELDPAFTRGLVGRIVDTVAEASRDLRPARFAMGSAELEGWSFNRVDSSRPVDNRVRFLRIERDGAGPVFLCHYACHPVYLPFDSTQVSADFPGAASRHLEQQEDAAFAQFLQGASGDVNPLRYNQGYQWALRHGEALAAAVLSGRAEHLPGPDRIRTRLQRVELPLNLDDARRESIAYLQQGVVRKNHDLLAWSGYLREWAVETLALLSAGWAPTLPVELQGIHLGGLILVGVPAEIVGALGAAIEKRGEGKAIWPVACANDNVGYLVEADEYAAESYAATMAPKILGNFPFSAATREALLQGVERLLAELPSGSPGDPR